MLPRRYTLACHRHRPTSRSWPAWPWATRLLHRVRPPVPAPGVRSRPRLGRRPRAPLKISPRKRSCAPGATPRPTTPAAARSPRGCWPSPATCPSTPCGCAGRNRPTRSASSLCSHRRRRHRSTTRSSSPAPSPLSQCCCDGLPDEQRRALLLAAFYGYTAKRDRRGGGSPTWHGEDPYPLGDARSCVPNARCDGAAMMTRVRRPARGRTRARLGHPRRDRAWPGVGPPRRLCRLPAARRRDVLRGRLVAAPRRRGGSTARLRVAGACPTDGRPSPDAARGGGSPQRRRGGPVRGGNYRRRRPPRDGQEATSICARRD